MAFRIDRSGTALFNGSMNQGLVDSVGADLGVGDMRPRGYTVFTFVVIVVLAGCSDTPKAPITPSPISPSVSASPISPSVSALSLSGIGVPLVEGQSVQLTATATLSNGTSSDVTARVS